uniref:Uncharacterized protein n=1 Tax=Arundo donax TaxID=35708 RepID=A0A0A8Z354_ARUDO
MMEVVCYYQ